MSRVARRLWRSPRRMGEGVSTEHNRAEDQHGAVGGPEDDNHELMERLRTAPAEHVLMDLFSTLLGTAQVKLGRRDARLFIDVCATMAEHAGGYLSDEANRQVETALGQLRMAQVNAEKEMTKQGRVEPNDLTRIPTVPAPGGRAATSVDPSAPTPSRLWVPGR